MLKLTSLTLALLVTALSPLAFAQDNTLHWAGVRAKDKFVRTELVNQGFSIENVLDDMSYGFAPAYLIEKIEKAGFEVTAHFPANEIRAMDFPSGDAIYHNYAEMNAELDALVAAHPTLVRKFSIGKTSQGRDIWGVRIGAHATDGLSPSGLPGIVFMGGHHAREHLSMEIPLLLAKHLAEARDGTVLRLLDTRDIFIIPMINPDGAEYDISTGSYQMWRKNRNANGGNRCAGVDINRNYGFQWGTGGSSTDACSDVFMGPKPFSEPESQAVKAFVEGHPNLKVLLSFHTFSELVLYPWGHKNDPIDNRADLSAFETMARTMAGWNGYTPQPTHDLYIASGDTTDWAYGALGIFAFTFEMSPRSMWGGGGFYPGPAEIQHSFQNNLRPALYLIDLADNPHRATSAPETTLFYGSR
ncbi:MAG TPA: M14 family metallopeptidase [Bdellovibrionota bacterium]|jgi:carboxypeptidase T